MVNPGEVGRLLLGLGFTTVGFWLLVRADQLAKDHRAHYRFYPMVASPLYPWALRVLGTASIPVDTVLAVSGIPGTDFDESSSQHELLIDVPAYFAGIFFIVVGMSLWMYVDDVHEVYRRRFPFIPGIRTRFYRWHLRLYGAFLGFVGMAIAFGVLI